MLFSSSNSLLISYQDFLLVIESGVIKSPTIIVDVSISIFSSISFCFMYFEFLLFYTYTFRIIRLFGILPLYHYKMSPFISNNTLFLKFVVVQSLSCIRLFAALWTAARLSFLSLTISQSLPKFMSIDSVMPSFLKFTLMLI